jgi:DNA-binding PadR family transcriptional regulator
MYIKNGGAMSYRTDTKALVLAVLQDGPLHGYGISREIKRRSSEALKLGEGQLYPILHALEEQGWVAGEWELQQGDPPRKVYCLTESGHGELQKRAEKWLKFTGAVASVLQKTEAAHES